MFFHPFKLIFKKFLGVDIGTSSIKIVELSQWGRQKKLENYGKIDAEALFKKPFRTFEKSTLTISTSDVARAILAILEEAKIETKEVAFSIPDFSSFFTWFTLPPMTKEELPEAVKYEARRHIPIPLSEVTLDWQIIQGRISQKTPLKILLVAVPNEIIHQYQKIAVLAGLKLQALEAEVFGLSRALLPQKEPGVIIIVDLGARTTTVSLIDKGILKRSHSFDVSGNELTAILSKSLGVDYSQAEEFKKKYGLKEVKIRNQEKSVRKILLPLIDLILNEIEKISKDFYRSETKEVEKVILAGGLARLPGLKEYFFQTLKKEIKIADPFSYLFFPSILEQTLKEMGPSFAIAVGMALRGLE